MTEEVGPMTVRGRFDDIVTAFVSRPGVTPPTGGARRFGSDSLRVGGSVFCMVSSGDRFVVKLPAERCREVIDGGDAAFLQMGRRTMREWVAVGVERAPEWVALAREALAFVRPRG